MGFLGNMKPWELILIILVVLLLFGAKRLPDAARGIGRSLRIFKAETKGLVTDDDGSAAAAPAAAPAAQVPPAVTSAPPQPVDASQPQREESTPTT